eukprot:6458819-Amphidinium_carterae.1
MDCKNLWPGCVVPAHASVAAHFSLPSNLESIPCEIASSKEGVILCNCHVMIRQRNSWFVFPWYFKNCPDCNTHSFKPVPN